MGNSFIFLNEQRGFDYFFQTAAGCLKNTFQVFHGLACFGLDIIGDQIPTYGVQRELAGNKDHGLRFNGLGIWADGPWRFIRGYNSACWF